MQELLTATPVDLTTELLRRERNHRNFVAGTEEKLQLRWPELGNEQILSVLEAKLAQHITAAIYPSHGTTIACTRCGRLEAPAYYLKRSHGKYAVLCFDNGNGCWEHSTNVNCSYTDQHNAQCLELAEWVVAYGPDLLKERHVCALHIPAVLSDVSEHRIYPIQD